VVVAKQIVILVSGIPATGKSEFARYLAREHGFAHYDLDYYPRGWPHPELREAWATDRADFILKIRQHRDRGVLDWGFPVSCLSWVKQLHAQGVGPIWFDGDVGRARAAFVRRGGIDVRCFDERVKKIQRAGYPGRLDCLVIPALSAAGAFLDPHKIESIVFQ
jgi:hypothetical protein